MKKELKNKWIEALRSGDYRQTRGKLKGDDGFCCLGVLAVISDLKIDASGTYILNENGENDDYAPLCPLFGIKSEIDPIIQNLINLNDSHKKTFSEIANWIEENVNETP